MSFRRRTGPPMVDTPVKNNPRADTGSNARIEDISIAAPRAPLSFRQSCRVGVIVDLHIHAVEPAHFLSQRIVVPDSKIRRVKDDARERIQRPRSTDSYRFNSRSSGISREQRLNRGRHRGEAFRSRTGCDHRGPAAHMNFSASVHQTSGNLRSSYIYSDDEPGCRFHFFSILLSRSGPVRQSIRSPEARELYMPPKKIASLPTPIGLVWQQSTAFTHRTFHLRGLSSSSSQAFLLVPILPQFLATAGSPVANMTIAGNHAGS